MSENDRIEPHELTEMQRDALRECARYRVGAYFWKPGAMRKLAAMALTYRTDTGAYALTHAGLDMVRAIKGGMR
ncbi:MAG: hypothetical protein LBV73_27480 [Paraburkholderia sp.]|jgi:hypothetical protein|nr:hypothetical protein [Paraburkholderia sp.]